MDSKDENFTKDPINNDECIDLKKILEKIQQLNSLREELVKLNLNPKLSIYYNYEVDPILTTLSYLTGAASNLSSSVNQLATSFVVRPKDSKIEDTIKLIYKINSQCEELYKVLQKKVDILLCVSTEEE